MAWIESHSELANHPKLIRLARLLGVSRPAAIGHLHLLWWWCVDYAQDGDLSRFDIEDIAAAAGWDGNPAQFVEALANCGPGGSYGFLERKSDGSFLVHDWDDYAGRLIAQREEKRERERARYIRQKAGTRKADERVSADRLPTDCRQSVGVLLPTNQPTNIHNQPDQPTSGAGIPTEHSGEERDPIQPAIDAYQQHIGLLNALQLKRLEHLCELTSPEAVVVAIEEAALKAKKPGIGYVAAVVQHWARLGVRTAEDARRALSAAELPRPQPGSKAEIQRELDELRRVRAEQEKRLREYGYHTAGPTEQASGPGSRAASARDHPPAAAPDG